MGQTGEYWLQMQPRLHKKSAQRIQPIKTHGQKNQGEQKNQRDEHQEPTQEELAPHQQLRPPYSYQQ
jgi:hypothetical protein